MPAAYAGDETELLEATLEEASLDGIVVAGATLEAAGVELGAALEARAVVVAAA